MEVKGQSVQSTLLFVQHRFRDRLQEWLGSLPPQSAEILSGKILDSDWYPLREAFIDPTRGVCDLFFQGSNRGAWEIGRFSADHSLRGIYRLFIRLGKPGFIVSRASIIFATYYRPSEMKTVENVPGRAVVHITHFPESHEMVELRICGWIERALELSGTTESQIQVARSLTCGDPLTEIRCTWKQRS